MIIPIKFPVPAHDATLTRATALVDEAIANAGGVRPEIVPVGREASPDPGMTINEVAGLALSLLKAAASAWSAFPRTSPVRKDFLHEGLFLDLAGIAWDQARADEERRAPPREFA